MKLGKLLTIAVTFCTLTASVSAQDIHFSQFYASPLNLNPAITGVMSCDMRVSVIYRNQWASVMGPNAFNTFSAGVEGKFQVGNSGDFYGLGLNLWADKAGASNFSTVHGSLSGSYLKKIGGNRSNEHYLVAGGQIGMTQRSITTTNLRWGLQWDGTAFDGSLDDGEFIDFNRTTYADINAGILWFSSLDRDNKSNVYGGVAFSHLTRANVAFLNQDFEALYTKFTVHAGGEFRLSKYARMALTPAIAFHRQGPSTEINVGTGFKFDFSKKNRSSQAFQIGAFTRMVNGPALTIDSTGTASGGGAIGADALILMTRIRFGSSHIGLSYDINISRLRTASRGNGAFELSYVYTLCGVRKRRLGCPTF